MTVTLFEVMGAARGHSATLAAECAGYWMLCVAELLVNQPAALDAEQVELNEDGGVRVRPPAFTSTATPEGSVRVLLGRLLEVSSSVGPALRRSAQPREDVGLPGLIRELETALIPVNRAAARRALSRLHRETDRAKARGRLDFAAQPSGAELEPSPRGAPALSVRPVAPAPSVRPVAPTEAERPEDWAPPPPVVASVPATALPDGAAPSATSEPPGAPALERSENVSELSLEAMLVAAAPVAPTRLRPPSSAPPRPPARLEDLQRGALAPSPHPAPGADRPLARAESEAFTKPEPVVLRARNGHVVTPQLGTRLAAAMTAAEPLSTAAEPLSTAAEPLSTAEPLLTEPMPPLALEESEVLPAEVEDVRPICLDEEDARLADRDSLRTEESSDDRRWLNEAPIARPEEGAHDAVYPLAAGAASNQSAESRVTPSPSLPPPPLVVAQALTFMPQGPAEVATSSPPRMGADDTAKAEHEPSVLPDVVMAMARVQSGLDEDQLPTRLSGVTTAPVSIPESGLEDISAWAIEAAVDAVPPLGEQAEAWLVDAGWHAASWGDHVDTSAPAPGAWSSDPPAPPLDSQRDLFEIDAGEVEAPAAAMASADFEPSPWAPVHLPAPRSDVTDLVRRFSVSEAPSEVELRSALRHLAGLEPTPMPVAGLVSGDGPRGR